MSRGWFRRFGTSRHEYNGNRYECTANGFGAYVVRDTLTDVTLSGAAPICTGCSQNITSPRYMGECYTCADIAVSLCKRLMRQIGNRRYNSNNPVAEIVLEQAKRMRDAAEVSPGVVRKVHHQLCAVLHPMHPFFVRWNYEFREELEQCHDGGCTCLST